MCVFLPTKKLSSVYSDQKMAHLKKYKFKLKPSLNGQNMIQQKNSSNSAQTRKTIRMTMIWASTKKVFILIFPGNEPGLNQKRVDHRLPLLTLSKFCSSSTAGYGMVLNS